MLKSVGFLVVAGGLVYTQVVEPTWVNWGVAGAQCWVDGGVWIQANAQEKSYVAEMSKSLENRARLESGEAKGCLPEPKCVMSPTEAVAMIDRKIVSWMAVAKYYRMKLNFNRAMHDGISPDLPGDGKAGFVAAKSRVDEADFCWRYLETSRATLVKALGDPNLTK